MKNTVLLLTTFMLLIVTGCKKEDTPGTNNNNNNQNNNNNNNNNNTPTHVNWVKQTERIQYAADGVTEASKTISTFDSEGKPTGTSTYYNGVLYTQYRNYTYNGNDAEYYIDNYNNGSLVNTQKQKVTNHLDWLDFSTVIAYEADEVTEKYKQTTTYDAEGRKTGLTVWQSGVLYNIGRDYTYNGNEQVYYSDGYNNGSVSSTTKIKTGNYKEWIQLAYYVQYKPDGVTESYRSENTYDASNRPTGTKTYVNGVLSNETKDYVYNGNEATYNSYTYLNGSVSNTTKYKVVFFNL